jgi:hypothetical protein
MALALLPPKNLANQVGVVNLDNHEAGEGRGS